MKTVVTKAVSDNNKEVTEERSDIGTDQEIIVKLESNKIVEHAGDNLFNKKTATKRPKVLLQYDEQTKQLRIEKIKDTNVIHLTENTKITLVGHGSQGTGRGTVGGKTAEELAKIVLKLRELDSPVHWSSGLQKVNEISIVACDVGAGEVGETFAKDFLLDLKNAKLSTSLSVRTTEVTVQEDGSKLTQDIDNPGKWGQNIPDHKRIFYLDEKNNLIEVSRTQEKNPAWEESPNFNIEHDPLPSRKRKWQRHLDNDPLYYSKDGVTYEVNDELVSQGIRDKVKEIFNTEVQEVPHEELQVFYKTDMNTEMIEETIKVQTVNGLEGLTDNIKYIIKTANEERQKLIDENSQLLGMSDTKIDNNLKLSDKWKMITDLKRSDNIIELAFNEIEPAMHNKVMYYRVKDYIYSINLDDFYVELYGTTNRNLVNEEFYNIRNEESVTYETMASGMRNKESFVDMAHKWVSNDQNIPDLHPYDGMAVLATHISEAVRNPDLIIINRVLWDVVHTWADFKYYNPMTRGETWSGNHAAIGLDYDYKTHEQVAEEAMINMKYWLSRKFKENYFYELPEDAPEPERMTIDNDEINIRSIVDQYLLRNIDINRPERETLSEGYQRYFRKQEERARGKSLETELQLKMVEDRQQLVEKITNTIKEQVSENFAKNWKVKSIENTDSGTTAVLENKMDPSLTKELSVPGDRGSLRSEEVLHSYYKNGPSVAGKINHGLAIYGTLMGFRGANEMFAEGRNWEGGVMLAQGVHGLTEFAGVNTAVNEYVANIAQKSISQISTGLDEASAAKFTSALTEAGEVVKAIPVISLGFTIFNIYEDLKQNTPIGIVDAVLDGAIFLTALAGPEMLPVTAALSVVRLLIDPMFYEIKHELDLLPPNASVGDKALAVLKGFALALKDIANTFVNIWEQISIPGILYNVYNLEQEHKKSIDFIHKLQTAENYYKILDEKDGDKCHKKIDFTLGEDSAYGGNLRVELTDHSSMIITVTDPLTANAIVKEIHYEDNCETVDLVMGIGEAVNIKMMQKTATVLWFIPLRKEEVISSLSPDDKSLHGTYVGNSKPNRFYAVQQNVIKGFSYTLDKYHYELYGNDGNDIFYLGPQNTFVHGGNGQDIYYIPNNGGQTEICNQANDKKMDLLIFNITLQEIHARKVKNDLKLFNNNLHEVLIKNWFVGEEYRHMTFKSMEGALFKIGQVQLNGIVTVEPFSLDFSNKGSSAEISLEDPQWRTVVSVIGSKYDDVILGNRLANVFQGRGGRNYLAGKDGRDMYIIEEKEDCDIINNYADDNLMDIVELPGSYADLKVATFPPQSVKIWDFSGKTCVIMKDWNKGWQWQHIVFKSKDFVLFQITNTSEPKIIPLILDYSDSTEGINIDLNSIPGNENIMTVIGSKHIDRILGNDKPNFIQSSKGGGWLMGRGGSDTYIIDCKDGNFYINNYAEDGTMDVLFIKENYGSLKSYTAFGSTLSITVTDTCIIDILNWYKSENHRHLLIQTEDGITFSIPSGTTPVIFAIDNSRDTLPIHVIDTSSGIYEGATKIMGPPRYIPIFGNIKQNYIDPGTNGAYMSGGEGRDTYILRKHYEGNYEINNCAADEKVDYLILDIYFKDIQYKVEKIYQHLHLSAPNAAKWECYLIMFGKSKYHRHLIVKTIDVWFTFSDQLEIQPLFVDERSLSTDLHLDLSTKSFHSVPTVYGSLQKRNFITGNTLNNTIIGGKDTDVLYGLEGNDLLQGSGGKDYLSGGAGDDKIHGGQGDDLILGCEGDDVIYPGQGADTVYGGTGSDTLLFSGDLGNKTGVFVNLHLGYGAGSDAEGDLYFGMENVIGTSYDDILIGSEDDNYIRGAGGNDLIQPLGGYDILQGGEGEDLYNLINATGVKMIDNFANDGKVDSIYVEHSAELKINKERFQNDLKITINYNSQEELKIFVKNWYNSEEYKHLLMKIVDWNVTNGNRDLHIYKEEILE
ncbi:uncharacterized protein RB166_000560 [Leptodactylus fuscus]